MQIEIKRYKEIEKIALSEAVVKIINEIGENNPKISALETALKGLQLQATDYLDILGYIKGILKKKGVFQ